MNKRWTFIRVSIRTRAGCSRGESGTVMIMTVVALPILFAFVIGIYQIAMYAYYRVQAQGAAESAALSIVQRQTHLWMPLPWTSLNLIFLDDVDFTTKNTADRARQSAEWMAPGVKIESRVVPPYIPFPIKYVHTKATVKLSGLAGTLFDNTVTGEACAIAWVNPKYMAVPYGNFDKLAVSWGFTDTKYRHYRLLPCGNYMTPLDALEAIAWSLGDASELADAKAALAELDHPDAQKRLDEKKNDPRQDKLPVGLDTVITPEEWKKCTVDMDACLAKTWEVSCPGSDQMIEVKIEWPDRKGPPRIPTLEEVQRAKCAPPPSSTPPAEKEGSS